MAEYGACITAQEAVLDINIKDLEVCGGSILIISQFTGEWGIKSSELAKYKGYLTKICEAFFSISFNYLPRLKIQFADALATLSSMIRYSRTDLQPIVVETHDRPVYCHCRNRGKK